MTTIERSPDAGTDVGDVTWDLSHLLDGRDEQALVDLLDAAERNTDGYRSWWSCIPDLIGTPGHVYAYACGQLRALSVHRQHEVQGSDFPSRYLHLFRAGGSMAPGALARIVGCDLGDPDFWDGGLRLVEAPLEAAEEAAAAPRS